MNHVTTRNIEIQPWSPPGDGARGTVIGPTEVRPNDKHFWKIKGNRVEVNRLHSGARETIGAGSDVLAQILDQLFFIFAFGDCLPGIFAAADQIIHRTAEDAGMKQHSQASGLGLLVDGVIRGVIVIFGNPDDLDAMKTALVKIFDQICRIPIKIEPPHRNNQVRALLERPGEFVVAAPRICQQSNFDHACLLAGVAEFLEEAIFGVTTADLIPKTIMNMGINHAHPEILLGFTLNQGLAILQDCVWQAKQNLEGFLELGLTS